MERTMNLHIDDLLESNIIEAVKNPEMLSTGTVIRRISRDKDQQGRFTRFDENGGLVVVNVVDMSSSSFLTEAGIIRPSRKDKLFCYTTSFGKSMKSSEAMEILTSWPLYRKNTGLRISMEYFFVSSFTPEHILYLKKNGMLDAVFVPMQQKLKIGRYTETVNWDTVRKEKFSYQLSSLKPGDHITYLALIPQTSSYRPKFYSIGTKPHEEIQMSLRTEAFNFKPTHGGHIKAEKIDSGVVFYVDAGSSYLGKGVKTKLETAENVVKALRREYSEFRFIPVEGRGAFGTDQSY